MKQCQLTPFFCEADVIAVSLIGEQGPVETTAQSGGMKLQRSWTRTKPTTFNQKRFCKRRLSTFSLKLDTFHRITETSQQD